MLSERGALSIRTTQIFKTVLSNALKEQLLPDSQFWSGEKTLKTMAEQYFSKDSNVVWPNTLKCMQSPNDHLGLTPASEWTLALKALGGCLWYLGRCLVDHQIVSMAKFQIYMPPDDINPESLDNLAEKVARKMESANVNRHMVLDSISLANLKIADADHSLLSTLDNCCTKFGKRLLHYWVCSPSCERSVIVQRQDAIRQLMENRELLQDIRGCLGSLPDLERQLAQIHTFGDGHRSKTHPDGRAIFFTQKTYNKRKIQVRLGPNGWW